MGPKTLIFLITAVPPSTASLGLPLTLGPNTRKSQGLQFLVTPLPVACLGLELFFNPSSVMEFTGLGSQFFTKPLSVTKFMFLGP